MVAQRTSSASVVAATDLRPRRGTHGTRWIDRASRPRPRARDRITPPHRARDFDRAGRLVRAAIAMAMRATDLWTSFGVCGACVMAELDSAPCLDLSWFAKRPRAILPRFA